MGAPRDSVPTGRRGRLNEAGERRIGASVGRLPPGRGGSRTTSITTDEDAC